MFIFNKNLPEKSQSSIFVLDPYTRTYLWDLMKLTKKDGKWFLKSQEDIQTLLNFEVADTNFRLYRQSLNVAYEIGEMPKPPIDKPLAKKKKIKRTAEQTGTDISCT